MYTEMDPAAIRAAIRAAVAAHYSTARGAWNKGVSIYADMLIENIYSADPVTEKTLLNGAPNWNEYSWGGCALIYDEDIARTLCNPSELRRTDNGRRRPNAREEWLDVQARALYQAARVILTVAPAALQTCRAAADPAPVALAALPVAGE